MDQSSWVQRVADVIETAEIKEFDAFVDAVRTERKRRA